MCHKRSNISSLPKMKKYHSGEALLNNVFITFSHFQHLLPNWKVLASHFLAIPKCNTSSWGWYRFDFSLEAPTMPNHFHLWSGSSSCAIIFGWLFVNIPCAMTQCSKNGKIIPCLTCANQWFLRKITPNFFVMLYSAELKSKDLQPLISKHLGTYRLFQFLTLSGFLLLLFFRPMRWQSVPYTVGKQMLLVTRGGNQRIWPSTLYEGEGNWLPLL